MPDTSAQLRTYYEDIVERVTAEEILDPVRPVTVSQRRRVPALLVVLAVAVVVVVVVGPTAWWFSSLRQADPAGPSPTSVPSTTLMSETTVTLLGTVTPVLPPVPGDTVLRVPAAVVPDRPQLASVAFDPAQMVWDRVEVPDSLFGEEGYPGLLVAFGSRLVLLGREGGFCGDERVAAVWVSEDGQVWSRLPDDSALELRQPGSLQCSHGFRDIVVGGPGLVAVGEIAGPAPTHYFEAVVWTSADGLTWTRSSPDGDNASASESTRLHTVYRGGPGLVAIGTSCEPPTGLALCDGDAEVTIWTSPDGLSWTRLEQTSGDFASLLAEASGSDPVRRLFLESVSGNDSGFVGAILTADGFDFWTSQDGIEWSKRPSMDTAPQSCFQWLGGRLVAADTSFVAWQTCNDLQDSGGEQDLGFSRYYSTVWTSDDGQTWTTTTFDPGATISNVVAVGSTFVAVGRVTDNLNSEPDIDDHRPMIWTSTDGSTWVPVDVGTDGVGAGTLRQVVIGGPGLVAWGESPDGPTLWVAVPGITP